MESTGTVRIPRHRAATHPGEVLLGDFLIPLKLTQKDLAAAIRVPFQRVNELVSGKRGMTPSTALRLAKYFGNSPAFWLNLQMRCDLQSAMKKERAELNRIKQIRKLAA
jgi:addiction module HigA family antidote